jgi:hypothetical protein
MDGRQDQNGKMLLLFYLFSFFPYIYKKASKETSNSLRKDGRGQHEVIHHPLGPFFISLLLLLLFEKKPFFFS